MCRAQIVQFFFCYVVPHALQSSFNQSINYQLIFSIEDGHVIPGLIHKCYLAKKNGKFT